jgi:hypothetical protein
VEAVSSRHPSKCSAEFTTVSKLKISLPKGRVQRENGMSDIEIER